MDPTTHIASVTLFHYLIGAIPLTDEEALHLQQCADCRSVLEEYRTYIDPAMIRAA
jgi:hypothetical protein